MKIVHYIPALSRRLGGVAMYMQLLAKELGDHCDLIVVTRPFDNPLHLDNCRVVNLPISQKKFQKAWKAFLEKEHPDLVHVNGIWQRDTWWIQKEALNFGIKTYITPHGMLEPWIIHHNYWKKFLAMFLYERKALKSAVNLVATAESERENIVKLHITDHEIPIIPNGIDVSNIKLKDTWEKRKRILFLSRIDKKKGIELLLETATSIKRALEKYEIIIAGKGDKKYTESLKSLARENNINVNFVGEVYAERKWELFREADFFVLPTHSENFGYVIAESLACGTPVITTKGAPWKDLEDWKCGRWIERTKDDLKATLLEMINKGSKELELMGRNGRTLIEQKYSAKVMAIELMKIYNK